MTFLRTIQVRHPVVVHRGSRGALIAAAGALGVAMLGIIIIIITRNGHVTVDKVKGNTIVTIQQKSDKGIGGIRRCRADW